MVANNSLNASLNLVDADFAGLQASFKTYLRSQSAFRDYDFDGSNLSLLIDLMSYNTFKNIFYLNMALSEGFLDSAQLRNSLLSHAKELNYLPRSVRSAKAEVTVAFEATGDTQPYIIPKGSQFSSQIKSTSYVFSVPQTIICSSANTSFTFSTDIYEGVYKKDAYVFLDNVENQRFKITNKNIDTSSLSVTVFEDGSEVGVTYILATTLLDLNELSKVFFLQTSEVGNYEVLFGDNNLGRQPHINSTIVLDYRVSSGPAGNGARKFDVDFDPTGVGELTNTPVLTVDAVAIDGDEQETNESIRYYAPRHFQVQERAVTTQDYEIALKTQFPEIRAVSVYGGEEVTPPQFGRVFISVDVTGVDGLPESKKDEYYQFIHRRRSLTITPVFVSPEFLYLSVNAFVRYNLNITPLSANRLKTLVTTAVLDYQTTFLDDFNSTVRHSQLATDIDACDLSVISNILDIQIYKKLNPIAGIPQNIDVNFDVPLIATMPDQTAKHPSSDQKTVSSSAFRLDGVLAKLEDDGNGVLRVVSQSQSFDTTIVNVGTVNYDTGAMKLINFKLDSYDGEALKIYAVPRDKDVTSNKNTILSIEGDEINVTTQGLRL